MRYAMAILLVLAACGGERSVDRSSEAMYDTAPDGALQCGTWAAPASVTPSCDDNTCACDFACVAIPAGGKAALHATFARSGGTWVVTSAVYGPGC